MSGIDWEAVLERVGETGRYQKRVLMLACLPAAVPATFLVFTHVFVSATPDHWCNTGNATATNVLYEANPDGTRHISRCFQYGNSTTSIVPCKNGWRYDHSLYDETLVTQFDLVCNKSWILSLSTTLFYTGSLVGNAFFGWASDRWGRKTVYYPILLCEVLLSVASACTSSFVFYTVIRTIRGLFFPAIFQIPFILGMELIGSSQRSVLSAAMCTISALTAASLALMAMMANDWRVLSMLTSLPLIPLLGTYWMVPESPRWLLTKNRIEEAETIVQKMAMDNGRSIPKNFLMALQAQCKENSDETENKSGSPWDLVRYPSIRYRYLIICVNMIACAVAYNALAYYTTHLGVNDFMAFFANALVEVPSYFIMGWFMDKFGRRLSLSLSMMIGGLACLSSIAIPSDLDWARVLVSLIGKLGSSAGFAVFYVYVAELIPTVLRAQAMGICSFISGIALLGFPYLIAQADKMRILPLMVIGMLSTTAGLLAILLPETKDTWLCQYAVQLKKAAEQSASK